MAVQDGYNSNLASEFHVLSCLHRLGQDATISLGNKKAVDIQLVRRSGMVVTIDVKASATKADWIAGKVVRGNTDRHFVALVGYEGLIQKLAIPPRVWIIPYAALAAFVKTYKRETRCIRRPLVESGGKQYEGAWSLLWTE